MIHNDTKHDTKKMTIKPDLLINRYGLNICTLFDSYNDYPEKTDLGNELTKELRNFKNDVRREERERIKKLIENNCKPISEGYCEYIKEIIKELSK